MRSDTIRRTAHADRVRYFLTLYHLHRDRGCGWLSAAVGAFQAERAAEAKYIGRQRERAHG